MGTYATSDTADARAIVRGIKKDPVLWANKLFGRKLWSYKDLLDPKLPPENQPFGPRRTPGQAEVIEAVFKYQKVAIGSGHTTGKTYLAPIVCALWMLSHPYCYVIITASTWDNVKSKVFAGLQNLVAKCREQGNFPFDVPKVMTQSWEIAPEWKAIGLSPKEQETIQGWHSVGAKAGTMLIVDEASIMTHKIHTAALSLLAGPDDRLFYIGNPTRSDGPFADALLGQAEGWHIINISSLNTPNVVHGKSVIPGLATRSWVNMMRDEYGEGSPIWQSRVLGQVPDQDDDALISRALVERALQEDVIPWQKDENLTLGVDVARSPTGAETVYIVRGEQAVHEVIGQRGRSAPKIRSTIRELKKKYNLSVDRVFVDATAIGVGLTDDLVELDGYPETLRVMNGASAQNSKDYRNRKSEDYARAKQWLKDGGTIPNRFRDKFVGKTGLSTIHYTLLESSGQMQVEAKAHYKDRVGKSPDYADAFALSFAAPVGERAFPCVGDWHRLGRRPEIVPHSMLRLTGYGDESLREGTLCRATWFSRIGISATVWVHLDREGCWTVYRSLSSNAVPARVYWNDVLEQSIEEEYGIDIFSGAEDSGARGQTALAEILYDVAESCGIDQYADFVESSTVTGMIGIQALDRMLLSSLARDPDNGYWYKARRNPKNFEDDAMLFIWPEDVLRGLERARVKSPSSWSTDPEEILDERLVGGGGPHVRCLRLLLVAGAEA